MKKMKNFAHFIKEYSEDGPISEKVSWFRSIFAEQIKEEGWYIMWMGLNEKYEIKILKNKIDSITEKQAYQYAKDYGWDVDNNGIISSHDNCNITRNRHLLTGTELGLL